MYIYTHIYTCISICTYIWICIYVYVYIYNMWIFPNAFTLTLQVFEWMFAMRLVWDYAEVSKDSSWKGLTYGYIFDSFRIFAYCEFYSAFNSWGPSALCASLIMAWICRILAFLCKFLWILNMSIDPRKTSLLVASLFLCSLTCVRVCVWGEGDGEGLKKMNWRCCVCV